MSEKAFFSGSEAIARGFYEAGGVLATGYAGVYITEILNEMHKRYMNIYSEISINEKVALEVSMGASIAGARTVTIMTQTGMNIALDSLVTFSQSYINGGFLVAILEDIGSLNSYSVQDARGLAKYSSIGIFSPSNSQDTKDFMKVALEASEKYNSPMMIIVNEYICEERGIVNLVEREQVLMKDFIPDQNKYVMFYPYIVQVQNRLRERLGKLEEYAYDCKINILEEQDGVEALIITASSVYSLLKEINIKASIYKLGFIYPISTKRLTELSSKYKKIIVLEEPNSFIENELKFKGIQCEGRKYFQVTGSLEIEDITKGLTLAGVLQESIPNISAVEDKGVINILTVENGEEVEDEGGKDKEGDGNGEESSDEEEIKESSKEVDGEVDTKNSNEEDDDKEKNIEKNSVTDEGEQIESNSEEDVKVEVDRYTEEIVEARNFDNSRNITVYNAPENRPIDTLSRTPVFFAGCPHLPIMNILKELKALVIGDIGCYTISVYYPWNLSQINMSVGSSAGLIKGMRKIFYRKSIEKPLVAIIGDGTFFHSGMLGIINLLNQYKREENITIIVLDNKSIASGGWEKSPGSKGSCYYQIKAFSAAGNSNERNEYLEIDKLLKGFGFYDISVVDQFKYIETKGIIKKAIDRPGISFIIAKRSCAMAYKIQAAPFYVKNNMCNGCRRCVELHCQAIRMVKDTSKNIEKAYIDPIICNGCSVCSQLCSNKAIIQTK